MITQARLKQLLDYDFATGLFTWRVSRGSVKAGANAGCKHGDGYLSIRLDGKMYLAHRLAWLYMHGYMPVEIDHKNLIRNDNRLSNLRDADRNKNQANTRKHKDNTSGYKSVCWDASRKKWIVYICVNRKRYFLGRYSNPQDAHAAYVAAAHKYFGQFARVS